MYKRQALIYVLNAYIFKRFSLASGIVLLSVFVIYPQLNKRDGERHDLRDTVIKVTSDTPLTASVERLGEGSKKQDAFYTEKYEAGVYTLTITHNGQVRVAIRAKATACLLYTSRCV